MTLLTPCLCPGQRPAPRTGQGLRRALALAAVALAGCASPLQDEADRLTRLGDYEAAYAVLAAAQAREGRSAPPPALQSALAQARDRVVVRALAQAEMALAAGRQEDATRLVARVASLDAQHPRLRSLEADLARLQRSALSTAQTTAQTTAAPPSPPPPAKATPSTARPGAEGAALSTLGPAFQRPVTLEFRDAPLRQVFESLARSTPINFVFDKDVRAEARVTVFLRGVSLDEALRVILATQQLDRKLLNETTVMVYPNTVPKQREHQELVTRTLYLVNTDVKQALTLVRTMAKTRDLHADERLNVLVVRDTPEVVRLVEQLVATIDLPEPEVMLAVEVMEIGTDRLDALGIGWPTEIQWGLPNVADALVPLSSLGSFRGSVANPALAAALRGQAGNANLLANPTLRARNREKAKVQIGEKLPVFSTTSATANVGASTTVSYLDVGIKLEVEPTVQLDGEVTIKVGLEVSNLLREVSGPAGSLAYQVGTRLTSTALRLKDGQTQVLSGLISDEDRKRAVGLPGLSTLPLVGRLFGVTTDTRNKTEIVMLITPRIVRNLPVPPTASTWLHAGTENNPGMAPLRLNRQAQVGVGQGARRPAGDAEAAPAAGEDPAEAAPASANAAPAEQRLLLAATPQAQVGDTVSITMVNRSAQALRGDLVFDNTQLAATSGDTSVGSLPFATGPRGEAVVVLRVLAGAAGTAAQVQVHGLSGPAGEPVAVQVQGQATVQVAALPPAAPGGAR
ncbi:MAG: secretin N-terminal domain-containing protein [Rubrivivax sp.]